MPYKNIVTGDSYIFQTLLPNILLSGKGKGLNVLCELIDIGIETKGDIDLYTDFTFISLGINHKKLWPLLVRIGNNLIFINGELAELKGRDFWQQGITLGEKYLKDIKGKESKVERVVQLIITDEEVEGDPLLTKRISWSKLLPEFALYFREAYPFKVINEKYSVVSGEYEEEREEDDLSFEVIKSMCRIHKDKLFVLFPGGTSSLTMASLSSLKNKKYKYIKSNDPLLSNKEPNTLIRGDVFLLIVNKK
ncbi:hypothetical protein SAMN02745227_00828 [Anaerobranca californiensis DSM 14826]|jgi:hypothetical protein|uniref:Uncharacterized protein n=1 Tax=Anaerobranca californiensis DSM 14826 TaxID=1120989 RepID=A0A1M6MLC5_9FIRM|nr:hypothetical protein [Anaerobranca californiensis]SHJ84206.1 hypothetical protein SAMN02745227_00828 [Anaerobranca californiensis DSM 14826]